MLEDIHNKGLIMTLIEDYVKNKTEGRKFEDVSKEIGVSVPMLSNYSRGLFNPSLPTAVKIYKLDGVVLHPFAKESLEYEVNKGA